MTVRVTQGGTKMSMKIYVEANSRAALNRRLAEGEVIEGRNYSMFAPATGPDRAGMHTLDTTLASGTLIAIYSQMSGGNPVSKSWGTWNGINAV